jgi:hypothetical protein
VLHPWSCSQILDKLEKYGLAYFEAASVKRKKSAITLTSDLDGEKRGKSEFTKVVRILSRYFLYYKTG